ncbi:arylformamidase [Thermoflavimicrobium daqui]|uniref:Kynurenine formamidase n=1 Tax=Thermoflavimicrobium daqui TaxID=2137476 RepID=A0A364K999_9BACL|nr:arylformamidase [Thermoflavimicrobium daqui]RAL26864.1 arylformamidase [Thermoflavimicrobium daqui]
MCLIDISEPLRAGVAGWPGDTPFSFTLNWTKEETGSVNVGKVIFSTHTGTHIDAPFHFDNEGQKVHELDLSLYVGPCRVIHLFDLPSIGAHDLAKYNLAGVERLIIRTDSWKDRSVFPTSFTYIRPDLGSYLQKQGIRLLGLDVPSVDLPDSKELLGHHSLHQHGVHILEGTVLYQVEEGDYELIALPLPIEGADGSLVRAVLRKI